MNQLVVGFIRGAVYAAVVAIVHYVAVSFGASGIAPDSIAGIVTMIFAAIDHKLPTP